jgi:hypothetical protein
MAERPENGNWLMGWTQTTEDEDSSPDFAARLGKNS